MVDQFERLAYDVVVAGGGRVVKMIGDEVMFLVDDPVSAAEIALGLAEASRDAAELSDVRVGLAVGPVIEREGDAFGATVNLASRATVDRLPGHRGGVTRAAGAPRGPPGVRVPEHAAALPQEHRPGDAARCSAAPTTPRPRSARRSTSAARRCARSCASGSRPGRRPMRADED